MLILKIFSTNLDFEENLIPKIYSVTHFPSKNVYFSKCHGKSSKVTAVEKRHNFMVDTPRKVGIPMDSP